jgi:hypothetical protein
VGNLPKSLENMENLKNLEQGEAFPPYILVANITVFV